MATVSTDNPYTFTVTGNRSLTAVFEKIIPTYTITAAIDPPEAGTVTGAGQYKEGETVTLKAEPADGQQLSKWTIDGAEVGTDETYTFIATKDVEITAAFEAAGNVPSGYTELQYIQSSGTQYIDTLTTPTTATVVDMKINNTSTPASNNTSSLFGSYAQVGTTNYQLRLFYSSSKLRICVATVFLDVISRFTAGTRNLIIDLPNKRYFNGSGYYGIGYNIDSISNDNKSMYMFAGNNNGTASCSSVPIRLYYLKISNGGVLVRDFVPCKNPSGAVGLYDKVSKTFFANKGTGAFTAGPAV